MLHFRGILTVAVLCMALAGLAGCKTMGKNVYPQRDTTRIGVVGTQETTLPGESVLSVSSAVYSWELELRNSVHGDGVGNSIDFPAGHYGRCFECVEEDDKYYYFYYDKALTLGGLGLGQQIRAGFRVNKQDHKDILAFSPSDIGYQSFDMEPAPRYEVKRMYNVEDEYRFKKITFVSCDDDILTLRYRKVEGLGGGEPLVEELTLQFDLLESKTIRVMGAEFEVLSATSDKLVVEVIEGLEL